MARSLFLIASALSLLLSLASAQTFTSCNPMERTDCPSNPALGTNATFNFTGAKIADSKVWNITAGKLKYQDEGVHFQIGGRGDSPTMQSTFYLFFGIVTVMLRAATGTGIVSSIVLQSEDLDEVDWELIGGNQTHVQTNYFGKGNTTSYDRAIWHPVSNPMGHFVNYTTHWTQEKIEWYIDGALVRTLKYEQALGGYNFPQTPMNIRIGVWSGGDVKNNNKGTVEWAGGETDFTKGPFIMAVKSVYAQDFTSGKEYIYGDKSGSFQSIKVQQGKSVVEQQINEPHGVVARWNALSKVAKIAIIASAIAVAVAFLVFILVCCIKQRRAGRREHAALEAQYRKEAAEREAFRRREFGFES